jgi:hypothetical protein
MTESAEAQLASCPNPEDERARQEQLLTKHIGAPEEAAHIPRAWPVTKPPY